MKFKKGHTSVKAFLTKSKNEIIIHFKKKTKHIEMVSPDNNNTTIYEDEEIFGEKDMYLVPRYDNLDRKREYFDSIPKAPLDCPIQSQLLEMDQKFKELGAQMISRLVVDTTIDNSCVTDMS